MNKKRFKPFCAVYLVLRKENKILFHKRKNSGYQDGNYGLVAGHLDGGETVKQAVIREAMEEANIKLNPNDLKEIHVMHRIIEGGREYIDIFIQSNSWKGEIKNMEPEKCSEISWIPEDYLPENILPEVKRAIKNIRSNIFFSEYKA